MSFTCQFCRTAWEIDHLELVIVRKEQLEAIKERKEQLEERKAEFVSELNNTEELSSSKRKTDLIKWINDLNEQLRIIEKNIEICHQRVCIECVKEWKNKADKVKKEEGIGIIQSFTCQICKEYRTGVINKMRVYDPLLELNDKWSLTNVCDYCKDNVYEYTITSADFPSMEEYETWNERRKEELYNEAVKKYRKK
jgi:hypothetical protein